MNWNLVLPPLVALVAATGGLAFMVVQLRKARLIEDTPTSRIRSAPQGYVELGGFARTPSGNDPDSGPLLAPLTQKPCVWFKYRIERYDRCGKNSRWETVESGTSENWFELDDDTARCFVDPRGAEVTPTIRECWKGSRMDHAFRKTHTSPIDMIFGDGVGNRFGGLFNFDFNFGGGELFSFRKEYRYTEWRIHAGTWLYTLGNFETLRGPSNADREQTQTRALLNQWKQNRDELLGRFDRNGDGEIDMQEWEEARRAAARAAQAQILKEAPAPALSVLCRPPGRRQPYLIATTDPEQLARRHRRHAALGLLFGAGIAAIALTHLQR